MGESLVSLLIRRKTPDVHKTPTATALQSVEELGGGITLVRALTVSGLPSSPHLLDPP